MFYNIISFIIVLQNHSSNFIIEGYIFLNFKIIVNTYPLPLEPAILGFSLDIDESVHYKYNIFSFILIKQGH